jgi:DNA polymerase-1
LDARSRVESNCAVYEGGLMIFSVDTETTGLDPYNGDKPFAITTCDMKGNTQYISIGEDDLVPIDCLLMNSKNETVYHNAKFDIQMLRVYGMEVNGKIHDTMIMSHIYNTDEQNNKLKTLAEKYLGVDNAEEEKLKAYIRKNKCNSYRDVPREIIEPYALKDARITLDLFKFYREKGVMQEPTYLTEMQLLKCLIAMQHRGVLIDTDFCKKNVQEITKKLIAIDKKIKDEHKGVNVRSPKQLGEYLFDVCGLKCDYFTPKGGPAFDEWNLSKYDHPIIPLILEKRELEKIKTTYLEALQEKADENNVVHCDFHQTGARTGRFSCSKPNLQNIPRDASIDVRRAFICRPDYTNFYFDYSQIELRILAHYSQEPKMIAEYLKKDTDLHSLTCKEVFGEITKQKRTLSKNINFGIIYGMGPKKFCEMVNKQYPDFNMSYTDARAFINKYYAAYQKVRTFTWRVPQKIMDLGYVVDVFGRKYTCPKGESYKGVNYLIQGCAAGIIKKAMIEIDTLLSDKKSNILLTIHDELVVEVHKDEHYIVDEIVLLMEDNETFRVPILVNVESTTSHWAEKTSHQSATTPA